MARSDNPMRQGAGAMDIDTLGRRNAFNKSLSTPEERRATRNFWRRKSTGGAGG